MISSLVSDFAATGGWQAALDLGPDAAMFCGQNCCGARAQDGS
jgi:hypothetical protein